MNNGHVSISAVFVKYQLISLISLSITYTEASEANLKDMDKRIKWNYHEFLIQPRQNKAQDTGMYD